MTEHERKMNIRSDDPEAKRILEERWLMESTIAIAEYNDHIERDGIFASTKRRF